MFTIYISEGDASTSTSSSSLSSSIFIKCEKFYNCRVHKCIRPIALICVRRTKLPFFRSLRTHSLARLFVHYLGLKVDR